MQRNKLGQFTSEGIRGNQFAKGNKPNRTTFKKGQFVMENHPSWKGGIQKLKTGEHYINLGQGKRIRRPRYNWEQVYGPLPKGYVIYHKDRDTTNDHIENLEAISRAELLKRNRNEMML